MDEGKGSFFTVLVKELSVDIQVFISVYWSVKDPTLLLPSVYETGSTVNHGYCSRISLEDGQKVTT